MPTDLNTFTFASHDNHKHDLTEKIPTKPI